MYVFSSINHLLVNEKVQPKDIYIYIDGDFSFYLNYYLNLFNLKADLECENTLISYPKVRNNLEKIFNNKKIASLKRNPLILDVLYRCKDVEKSGTGFQRMNRLCNEHNIKWSYEKSGYGFTFIFYRVTNNPKNVTNDVTLSNLKLSEKEVYELIKANSKITREDISNKINKNIRKVQRITNSLVLKGYILRIGNNRFGYWEVIK